jgi:hypothetical protein
MSLHSFKASLIPVTPSNNTVVRLILVDDRQQVEALIDKRFGRGFPRFRYDCTWNLNVTLSQRQILASSNSQPTMAEAVKNAAQAVADKVANADVVQTLTDKVASTGIASSSTNTPAATSAPNLQLDEETGEMVSKSECKLLQACYTGNLADGSP